MGVRRRIPVAQTLPVRPKTVWNGFCVTCICGMIMWCFVLFVVLIYLGGGGGWRGTEYGDLWTGLIAWLCQLQLTVATTELSTAVLHREKSVLGS